jgi:hydroxyacylglutathione hydrolase
MLFCGALPIVCGQSEGIVKMILNYSRISFIGFTTLLFGMAAVIFAQAPQPDGAGMKRGVLPDRWQVSGPECPADPKFQVHEYNEDLFILRESGCSNYEKPFLYLLFGTDKVFMLDIGAGKTDVAEVVKSVIQNWLARNHRDAIPLVVAHTHAHGDHIAGDSQLKLLPNATVVGLSPVAVQSFFGFGNWPEEITQYDLGGRVLDVIPIPGHEASSIAIYDRQTGILFTGDTLYPGRLYVADGPAYIRSIQRLVDFTSGKIVTHLLGNHIEETRTPFLDYPIGTVHQPDEHLLELGRAHLLELNDALQKMNGKVVRMAMRDFTVWPH